MEPKHTHLAGCSFDLARENEYESPYSEHIFFLLSHSIFFLSTLPNLLGSQVPGGYTWYQDPGSPGAAGTANSRGMEVRLDSRDL